MSELKPETSFEETSRSSPPKKQGHFKRHWKKYLIALIVLIVVIVIVVPVVILVAVPKIAQKKLNNADLTVDGISITQARPNEYNMAINSTIRSDGKVHAKVAPFTGNLYLEDDPDHTVFATVDFPETSSDKEQTVNVTQDNTKVTNLEALTKFNTWLLTNETLRLTIDGKTTVKVRGLPKNYGVDFHKVVELNGLKDFEGVVVTKPEITLTVKNNFRADVTIPNRSVFQLDLGNTTFRNFLGDDEIGTVYMDDLRLVPGDNKRSIRADIEQAPVLRAVAQRPNCEDGIVRFTLRGKKVEVDGEDISYFTNALEQSSQEVDVNIAEGLKFSNMTATCDGVSVESED